MKAVCFACCTATKPVAAIWRSKVALPIDHGKIAMISIGSSSTKPGMDDAEACRHHLWSPPKRCRYWTKTSSAPPEGDLQAATMLKV